MAAANAAQFMADMEKINEVLGKTITWNPELSQTAQGPVLWWMVVFALTLLGVFSIIARRYSQQLSPYIPQEEPLKIGGWLILMALGLCFTPLQICRTLVENKYFDRLFWTGLNGNANEIFVKTLWVVELAFNLFLFVFSILILYLFFNKRYNFPKVLATFMVLYLVFAGGEWLLCMQFKDVFDKEAIDKLGIDFVSQVIRSVIWVPYLFMSERVKHTFVTTLPLRETTYTDSEDEHQSQEQ